MVRRSTVDRSPHLAEHGLDYESGTEFSGRDQTERSRAGANLGRRGRPLARLALPRVAWAVLLLIGYRGVVAILSDESGSAQPAPVASAPAGQRVPGHPRGRLRPAVRPGVPELQSGRRRTARGRAGRLPAQRIRPAAGLERPGHLGQLQSEQVAATDVQDAHHAVVTLLARVNGQLMQLGVPVYASSDGLVVSSAPAWLPAPGPSHPALARHTGSDSATQAVLTNQLPAFFQAYASGNQVTLGRFLAPGTSLTGLNGAVNFHSILLSPSPRAARPAISLRPSSGAFRPRTPSGQVIKGGAPAQLQMSYALTVVKQNGTWYVRDISAATESPGSP